VTPLPRSRWWRAAVALAAIAGGAVAGGACQERPPAAPPLFEQLAPSASGVAFANTLPEDSAFNILNYLYYYNGGGVAVGDVDNDGLPDLYFSANVGPNRLYLNRGGYRFEDATERAGVAGPPGWKTGVTMADVNGDGWTDIYASAVRYGAMQGRNVLYVNDGDGTFTDRTAEFGLEHEGYSTQAAFLDYDGDGDLDMYLVNHSTHTERAIGRTGRRGAPAPATAADRLFRNDGRALHRRDRAAGIRDDIDGYGLGVVASDLDGDGLPRPLRRERLPGRRPAVPQQLRRHLHRPTRARDAPHEPLLDGRGRRRRGRRRAPRPVRRRHAPEREAVLKSSASSEGFNLFNLRLRPATTRSTRATPCSATGRRPL
jgi:hypothetical protein